MKRIHLPKKNVKTNIVLPRRLALLFDPVVLSGVVLYSYIIFVIVKLYEVKFDLYKLAKRSILVDHLSPRGRFATLLLCIIEWALITLAVVVFVNNFLSNGATLSRSMLRNTDMKGKVALVTGGYSGIGYETVLQLLKWNCNVVILDINVQNTTKIIDKLKKSLSFDENNLTFIEVDLDDLPSVKKAVKTFLKKYDRLDFLINNAGVYRRGLGLARTNIEKNFATNVLGPFYLTQLLLDVLKKTGGRILNVASITHYRYDPTTDPILETKSTTSLKESINNMYYGRSKLYIIWMTHAITRRLASESKNILCVCLGPGIVLTPMNWPTNKAHRCYVPRPFIPLIMKNPRGGAATILYLCAVDSKKLVPGGYYDNKMLAFVSKFAHDQEREEKLYKLAQEFVNKLS